MSKAKGETANAEPISGSVLDGGKWDSELKALKTVLAEVDKLDPGGRRRVLCAVAVFYDIPA